MRKSLNRYFLNIFHRQKLNVVYSGKECKIRPGKGPCLPCNFPGFQGFDLTDSIIITARQAGPQAAATLAESRIGFYFSQ